MKPIVLQKNLLTTRTDYCVDKIVIDGITFSEMIKGALGELVFYEKEIDDLNVFPVPDGDTGANMRRTLELGVKNAQKTERLNEYLEKLSTGMLFGARGNSGVILSQIFKGVAVALSEKERASDRDFLDALSFGYSTAYNTVLNPVEGTILTVLRDGVNKTKVAEFNGVESMLEKLITEMKRVLEKTPELLPVLKEAGVVDSGGFGLVKITEGMLKAYRGEKIDYEPTVQSDKEAIDYSAFDEYSEFSFGYCMEFILQLRADRIDIDAFSKHAFVEEISPHGNSIVAIRDKSRVRVHIHTFTPEAVISLSRKYGEFVFFKLDNMALQHNETVAEKARSPHKELEIISVVNGTELAPLFSELGSGVTINGASVRDIVSALESANADTVLILPNDKNVVQTANQAVKMYNNDKVRVEVVPTKSVAEGYFALASDLPDSPCDERITSVKNGASGVSTVSVFKCARNRTNNGISCSVGDYASFVDGKLVSSSKDLFEAASVALRAVKKIDEKDMARVFAGNVDGMDEIIEKMGEMFSHLQIEIIDGAFSEEKLVIGVV